MSDEGFTEDEFQTLQEMGVALDFLLPEGFPDTPSIAKRIAVLFSYPVNNEYWK